MQSTDTIVIGGGQAGLATSYHLRQQKTDHLILEKDARAAHAWRDDRWDSFTLVSPNWALQMPGAEYRGDNPDGFLPRKEIVTYFEDYIKKFDLPIRYNAPVSTVEPLNGGYRVRTDGEEYKARNVIVATGLFQHPKIPAYSREIPASVDQIHSGEYRNPHSLPAGAVLVVGSAQSGCQIADELYQSGRRVYLCTGSAGRAPRRYRGRDAFAWLHQVGFFNRTVDKLPSPRAKFAGNPHLTGRDGGHSLNLHQFARDGVHLLGRLVGANGGHILLAGDLHENLAKADKFESDLVKMIDDYIAQNGLDAPVESLPALKDGYSVENVRELDLTAHGITSIIWALGYDFDFSMIRLPVTDGDGYPIQQRGVTGYPGIYFVGMPWLHKYQSGLLVGVAEDAAFVASHIAEHRR